MLEKIEILIAESIKKISPEKGDIVLIECDESLIKEYKRIIAAFEHWKQETSINAVFIISSPGAKITPSIIPEKQLNDHGWYKKGK